MATRADIRAAALDSSDLPLNLSRAIQAVAGLRGSTALVSAAGFLACALVLTPWVWYYDLQPTATWIGTHKETVLGSLPGVLAFAAPAIGVLMFLAFTLFEFTFSRIAAEGVRWAEYLAYGAAVFDAVTDWPRVRDTMAAPAVWAFFEVNFGWGAGPMWYAARIGLLALATLGFEMLWMICVVCAVVCLVNGVRKSTGVVRP